MPDPTIPTVHEAKRRSLCCCDVQEQYFLDKISAMETL